MVDTIFFDVDGTLVPKGGQHLPPRTLNALHTLRRKGIRLFLATGRHISMLDGIRADFEFDGYATVNGQHCTCGGQTVLSNPIPPLGLQELTRAAQDSGFSCIFLEGSDCWMNLSDAPAREFLREFNVSPPPVLPLEHASGRTVYQVIVLLDRLHEHLLLDHASHLSVTRWHPLFLDALAPGGGKAAGVSAILHHLDAKPENAIAFGDGGNDISMLKLAGIGVAVGQNDPLVCAAADHVTACAEHEGVVDALEHFGLL